MESLGKFFRSIRFRLAAWSVIILAIVLFVFCVFVYTRTRQNLRADDLTILARRTTLISSVIAQSQMGSPPGEDEGIIPSLTPGETAVLQEDEVLLLVDTQGSVQQKVGPVNTKEVNQLIAAAGQINANSSPPYTFTAKAGPPTGYVTPQQYIFLVTPIVDHRNLVGYFVLGRPFDPNGQMPRLLLTMIFASLGTLLLSIAGGYWLAERAMHPVGIITHAAREMSETDLSRRLNLDTGDELGELANTFDQMLARLQAAFTRQRQFTADASHELRTPLTIVNLEAGRALEAHRSAAEYERVLKVIQSENEYMTRLVNNLLTLARLDAGQAKMQFEPVDLSDVVLDVIERLAPLAHKRGVELTAGELPESMVSGDRSYLIQMTSNLVENAIKYVQAEQPQVRVETGCTDSQVWLRVSDNGPGIPTEHLPHLFDRFYQVDTARTRGPEPDEAEEEGTPLASGTGLGLSIVQWIAKAHNGQASVSSQVGSGSTFEVRLRAYVDGRG